MKMRMQTMRIAAVWYLIAILYFVEGAVGQAVDLVRLQPAGAVLLLLVFFVLLTVPEQRRLEPEKRFLWLWRQALPVPLSVGLLLCVHAWWHGSAAGPPVAGFLGALLFLFQMALVAALCPQRYDRAVFCWFGSVLCLFLMEQLMLPYTAVTALIVPSMIYRMAGSGALAWESIAAAGIWGLVFFGVVASRRRLRRAAAGVFLAASAAAAVLLLRPDLLPLPLDLSSAQLHTPAPATAAAIRQLQQPVEALLFTFPLPAGAGRDAYDRYQVQLQDQQRWRQLLAWASRLNPRFKWREVKMLLEPETVLQYEVIVPGTVQFLSGEKKFQVTQEQFRPLLYDGKRLRRIPLHEPVLYETVRKILRNDLKKICFTAGHSEMNPEEDGINGAGRLCRALLREGYAVTAVDLMAAGAVPSGCAVLAVAAPKTPFSAIETAAVSNYLSQGGRVVLWIDPVRPEAAGPLLDLISCGRLTVQFFPRGNGRGRTHLFSGHEITGPLLQRGVQAVSDGTAVLRSIDGKAVPVQLSELLRRDHESATAFAVAWQGMSGRPVKGVVFSDAGLIRNDRMVHYPGNRELALNSFKWLLEEPGVYTYRVAAYAAQSIRGPLPLPETGLFLFGVPVLGFFVMQLIRARRSAAGS